MKFKSNNILLIMALLCTCSALASCNKGNKPSVDTSNVFIDDDDPEVIEFKILSSKDVKIEYNEGDLFDPTGLTFYAKWNHGVEEDDLTYMDVEYSPSRSLTKDDTVITFTYESATCELPIVVKSLVISDLQIDRSPIGEMAILGNIVDLTKVKATTKIDGIDVNVDSSKLSFMDGNNEIKNPELFIPTLGKHTITVKYVSLSATFDFEVVDKIDKLIIKSSIPATIANGTIINLSKVAAKAVVGKYEITIDTSKLTFKESDVVISNITTCVFEKGKHIITVSYLDKEATIEFEVINLESFVSYQMPTKTITGIGNIKYELNGGEKITNFKGTNFEINGSYLEVVETKEVEAKKLGMSMELYCLRGQYYVRNMEVIGQKIRFHIYSENEGKAQISMLGCSNIFESWQTKHLSELKIKDAFKVSKVDGESLNEIVILDNAIFPSVDASDSAAANDIFNGAMVEALLGETTLVKGDNVFEIECIMDNKKGQAGVENDPYYSGATKWCKTANIAGLQFRIL